jgi:hypothetical protein
MEPRKAGVKFKCCQIRSHIAQPLFNLGRHASIKDNTPINLSSGVSAARARDRWICRARISHACVRQTCVGRVEKQKDNFSCLRTRKRH